jgi:TolB-like protein/AraC-like DNA-binding protein/Tfp pilus assembly protein PilF
MQNLNTIDNDFLKKIIEVIDKNISNENFGVSELAREIGMSRSNLLRKINKLTNLSASQFIRQARLQRAMELVKQASANVSEIAYKVGFSSTSYFIKCFREYYGYPPGEAGKRRNKINARPATKLSGTRDKAIVAGASIVFILLIMTGVIIVRSANSKSVEKEKSIAVLPFKNDSNDSTNVYFINGLMESILTHLQKVEGLRVISRTSVEKYRNNPKVGSEIAEELNVNYFVEGSGQKIGDQILLHIQVIDATADKQIWAKEYNRQIKDIFKIQAEIAKNIANEIQVIITPEEEERINKVPTDNLIAYDYYLKGLESYNTATYAGLVTSINNFKKAIEHDNNFALAYANTAMSYYYLDIIKMERKYIDTINYYADRALLYDPKLPQSLVAKALYYMNTGKFDLALPYLEKALEYNPNSAFVINCLSDFYTTYMPNSAKYLEYALKGIRLDIDDDSATASFTYLHLSNALIQNGFVDDALKYVNKSLEYNPRNLFSEEVKAYILYAKNRNLEETRELLTKALNKDTTRLDILQEVGKACYFMRDYKSAYKYYRRFLDVREAYNLDMYWYENSKIGYVLSEMGYKEEAKKYFEQYKAFAEKDNSIYKDIMLATYYIYLEDYPNAIHHFRLFSEQDNYHFWIILFFNTDPLWDEFRKLPEAQKIFHKIESKFRKNHKQIKVSLEEKGLL